MLKQVLWVVVKIKVRVARGQSWLYYIKDVAYVSIVLYIFESVLRRFGVDNPLMYRYLYIVLPIAYFITCYALGYLDEKYGIWKMESVYGSRELNPFLENIDRKVSMLLERRP